jgi:hypothetical protein
MTSYSQIGSELLGGATKNSSLSVRVCFLLIMSASVSIGRIPNLVWFGPRGSGKRTAVQTFLKEYAIRLGHTYTLQAKRWQLQNSDGEGEISTSVEETASSAKDEKKGLAYEISRIHKGFDVARMSLQDKNYIQAILANFQGTSNILLGEGPGASHILVFYHAHLLSEESVILIQEVLEKFSSTVTFLLTSEYPLSRRLSDWFYEIPYPGPDRSYLALAATHSGLQAVDKDGQGDAWLHFFDKSFDTWRARKGRPWNVSVVLEIRQWIYTCMQRNLRWCDMILYWSQTIHRKLEKGVIGCEEAAECLRYLANVTMGGGFVMLPSYRIPVAWEQFMIEFLERFAGA